MATVTMVTARERNKKKECRMLGMREGNNTVTWQKDESASWPMRGSEGPQVRDLSSSLLGKH